MKYLLLLSLSAICVPIHPEWHPAYHHDLPELPPIQFERPEPPVEDPWHPPVHCYHCGHHELPPENGVPEPGTVVLVGVGVTLVLLARKGGGA